MVFKRTSMKRKRKIGCSSPLLDDTPKRTKVHAQRKFAQGSNVNSPVITPIKELESEIPKRDVLPEPVELLPMKRPNTEDFLTFLCFRGTPILPPSLSFFNTASIVDTNGQVHEIKEESPKNGPIDIAKCGSSTEKPFIAFGVRKRADPIVISRQMDRKRRHALALQALRRKYQEQKMAKIRALTISKLSEKVTNKTLVRTNTVSKTETVTKKTNTLQKTKVVATKHVKVTTETLKTTVRPKIKPKMCLRSFRGRFVHKELPFRKRVVGDKKIIKKSMLQKPETKKQADDEESEYESEDEEPLAVPLKESKPKIVPNKVIKKTVPTVDTSPRVTRSSPSNKKVQLRIHQMKKRILLSTPTTNVKPRSVRSTTMKKTILSQRKSKTVKTKQKLKAQHRVQTYLTNKSKLVEEAKNKKEMKSVDKKDSPKSANEQKKEVKKSPDIKKDGKIIEKESRGNKSSDGKKEVVKTVDVKKEVNKTTDIKKINNRLVEKKEVLSKSVNKEIRKSTDIKKEKNESSADKSTPQAKKESKTPIEKNKKETSSVVQNKRTRNDEKLSKTEEVDKSLRNKNIHSGEKSKKGISADDIKPQDGPIDRSKRNIKNNAEEKKIPEKSVEKNDLDANDTDKNKRNVKSKPTEIKKAIVDKSGKSETNQVTSEKPRRNYRAIQPSENKKEDETTETEKSANLDKTKRNIKAEKPPSALPKKPTKELSDNSSKKDAVLKKEPPKSNEPPKKDKIASKPKREPPKKLEIVKQFEAVPKRAETDDSLLTKTQRPTRKTKEAAAIYMEILSHKLVNDSQVDEDNISIDSFPELPNVKKTEQRENELKAQAKYTKEDGKDKCKVEDEESDEIQPPEEVLQEKSAIKEEDVCVEAKKSVGKRKTGKDVNTEVNSPENVKKLKVNKAVKEEDVSKRQTRNSTQVNKKENTDDSDESFHVDIKVPRVKKFTRSKTVKNDTPAKTTVVKTKSLKSYSSTDSDESTTSDVNLQTLANKAKNKKFSKTKSSTKKHDTAFSDSDEEPLSKLTNRSIEGSQKSTVPEDKLKEKLPVQQVKDKIVPRQITKSKNSKTSQSSTVEQQNIKPKRECAKRPQNYLPMLSSSDEDDIFHGFDEKTEEKVIPVSSNEPHCSHDTPFLDLLSKDVGRRFGKEKVNMSKEQIEKWLKDSALAGSSIKKENDEMLKFGERVPTESSVSSAELAKVNTLEAKSKKKTDDVSCDVKTEKSEVKSINPNKPFVLDRKLIFRKSKKDSIPNVNAFSPENESSVYAFGEENEDVISTPFRRPSRRPSSTATSRSEDESSKHDDSLKVGPFRKPTLKQEVSKNKDESDVNVDTDESSHHFYIPQKPTKANVKPQKTAKPNFKTATEKIIEADDFKYKIPSSPSASSSSSAKLYRRQTQKQKIRPPETINPLFVSDFPKNTEPAKLVEAPVFHPTDQEFQDPLEYIERIRHKAEQFGICRIVPPTSFKPECKVMDDMRFTAYNQYVHKMLHRWGPNFKELMAIRKYLETQNISLTHPPWIGGMEIDLPRLYQTVQTLGGLKEVIEKKKWPRVSEMMKIPKSAQDRVTKLDDIYCKYLLPYDTLSPAEREKLFDEVETEWAKRESKTLLKVQQKSVGDEAAGDGDSDGEDNEAEECITKGRNMALNAFYRIARNTMSMYFKTPEPTAQEVEQEYWKHVMLRQNHICVHSGSIDSGSWGYGFAISKNSPFARHSWNLKVLTNNSGSVLRSLGPIMGVTIPTLHVGMVFSACCWNRDPHGLPWIEYLHTGGSKIWYAIPNSTSELFRMALTNLVPNYCKNNKLWLPSDTVMVPPNLLIENNVSLCRTVQDPGQFIVVFPKAFTSSLATGYVVSESVYFAPPYWLKTARNLFEDLRNSKEPAMFSLDRLILNIASDGRCNAEVLKQVLPYLIALCDSEKEKRLKLRSFGPMEEERVPLPEASNRKKKRLQGDEGEYECEICRMNLYISMVFDCNEAVTYCLDHALEAIEKKKLLIGNCKFMFTYDADEMENLPNKIKQTIESKSQKKVPNKYAGMPTLLK